MGSLYNHKRNCNHTSKDNEPVCSDNNINLLMNELQRRDEAHKKQIEEQQKEQQKQFE